MKRYSLLFYVIPAVSLIVACGQRNASEFPKLKGMYLEQKPPGMTAELFARGLVSTEHHEHSRIEFSQDGLELYWAVIPVDTSQRSETGRPFRSDLQNIWYTMKTEKGWTDPSILPITKNSNASSPELSAGGSTLYYKALDPAADPDVRPKPSFLYGASKSDSGWINPKIIEGLLPNKKGMGFMSFCFADNGNIYFDYGGPDESGEWWWKICFSELKDGRYEEPVLMEFGINDGLVDWCPWIAPDESYLIWSSHREGCIGSGDLYISFRNDDGTWGDPANMGKSVNTSKQERFPSVSPDGKYVFFARHADSKTFSDIYWADAEIIERLKLKKLK